MLDAEQLNAMTPEERLELFESLAQRKYGTDRFDTALAKDAGYTRPSVWGWRKENRSIPYTVFFWLELSTMTESERAEASQQTEAERNLARAAEALAKAAEQQAHAAKELTALGKFMRR